MNDNINISYIDGIRFHRALASGIHNVISRQEYLNKINVFPVPDSDTGTNMAFTLNAVLNGTSTKVCNSISDMLFTIADSALDGARGNSGAILAQFFQGMSDGCKNSTKMTPEEFAQAIKIGSEYAREALGEPREGTILTILTDFSNHLIMEIKNGKTDFLELFNSAVKVSEISLKNTPNQLKVLKKAGVVDAGAQGFVDLLHGIQKFIEDGNIKKLDFTNVLKNTTHSDDHVISEETDLSYRFCTECLILGKNIDRKNLRSELKNFGNSLVLAGTKEKTKIHIHTNEPGKLFKFSEKFGKVINQKADDMFKQNKDAHGDHGEIAIITDSGSDIPEDLIDKYNIHIVPVRYNFGDIDYIDKVSLTSKEFYYELENNLNHPQTSQPTPGDFRKQYEFLISHYKSIISIHLPKELSGTMQSAQTASNKFNNSKNISVIDSLSISGGMGLIVSYAAEAANLGYSKSEIEKLIHKIIPKTNVYASVFDLNYSVKGGRVPKIVKTISDLFKFHPILATDDLGKMKISGGFFGKKNFAKKTAKQLISKTKKNKEYRIIISHCNCEERAYKLIENLKKNSVKINYSYVIDCGSALGVHLGPGSLVAGIQEYIPIKPKK